MPLPFDRAAAPLSTVVQVVPLPGIEQIILYLVVVVSMVWVGILIERSRK